MGHLFIRHRLPIVLVLLSAFAVRLLWLQDPGYIDDTEGFTVPWMRTAAHEGAHAVYARYDIVYPPASIYLLGLIGAAASSPMAMGPITPAELVFLKTTGIAFDLALVALLYRLGRMVGGRRTALLGAALYAFCPPMILITGWWGQIDSWFILFMFLAVWALWRQRPLLAWSVLGVALVFKVQAVVLLPLAVLTTWRQARWQRLLMGIAVLAVVVVAAALPVIRRDPQTPLAVRVSQTARDFPYISAQGHNLWFALAPAGRGRGLDIHSDLNATGLGVSYRDVGLALLAVGYSGLLAVLFVRRDRRLVFLGAAMAWLLFFMLPTRIHARFLLPALPFFVAAGFFGRRWWWLYAAFSLTLLVNLLERAGMLSPWAGWLRVTPTMSLVNAWVNVGLFALAWVWLVRSPVDDPRPAAAPLLAWEKAFLTLWATALLTGIALVWWQGRMLGREIAAWSADLPAALAARLAESDPAQTVIVNWPRAIAADARLFGFIPVTPPATFLPLPGDIAPVATWVQYPPLQESGHWQITYHGDYVTEAQLQENVAAAATVLAFRPQEPTVYVLARQEQAPSTAPCPVRFGNAVCLLEATLDAAVAGWWRLDLVWRVLTPPASSPTVFVHGLSADGRLLAQVDGPPAGGLLPFKSLGGPRTVLRETRFLPALGETARARIGVYDPLTGERAPAHCDAGFTCAPDAVELSP